MFWEKKLALWADNLRTTTNIPARVSLWNGQSHDLGTFQSPAITLHAKSAAAMPLLLSPGLDTLGEAYVEGKLDIDGSLTDIIDIGYTLARTSPDTSRKLRRVADYFAHSKASDKRAIQYHYDVSNDFYKLWLDRRMVYSCAYFENGDEDLTTAQQKKIDQILTKIQLQPGQTLLDIGCGWGALVIRAARKFGARCVGITLSKNQFDWATELVRTKHLADRVEIRLQDYRDVTERFDRVTSVGMFEHVGCSNLPEYFARVQGLLVEDGIAMNHGITSTSASLDEMGVGGGAFIDRYVFPDGELPHLSLAISAMHEGGLEAFDIENLRRHYARTLQLWSANYEANAAQLRKLVDERTFRIWRVYLAGCAYAFENDDVAIYQIVARKAGMRASKLPWSRRYIYDGQCG
ncbi:class I SAM-dependent methyltransferase [Caballeronia grimmiae]|uniref:class I SAM-dependent methyltransferase n=1 Tax=Caballeronia grimmiae TaxID=1071679 RepID=UPI0038BDB5C7